MCFPPGHRSVSLDGDTGFIYTDTLNRNGKGTGFGLDELNEPRECHLNMPLSKFLILSVVFCSGRRLEIGLGLFAIGSENEAEPYTVSRNCG